jgi:hypothetical protein
VAGENGIYPTVLLLVGAVAVIFIFVEASALNAYYALSIYDTLTLSVVGIIVVSPEFSCIVQLSA